VILGAGSGGLEPSSRLSAELAGEADVTLINQSDSFIFGFSKPDVTFARRAMDEVRIPQSGPSPSLVSAPATFPSRPPRPAILVAVPGDLRPPGR